MTYRAVGDDWCSTSHHPSVCGGTKILSGVCKPADAGALANFKELQNQLNRVAQTSGWSLLDVDGRLGAKTVEYYNRAQGGNITDCNMLSSITVSGTSVATIRMIADQMNAPAVVKAPITSQPSSVDPRTGQIKDPPGLAITDAVFGLVSSPWGLAIAAGLGFAAWKLYKTPVGGSKRPARRKARARRRVTRRRRR